jgi:proteic killer suppression protein
MIQSIYFILICLLVSIPTADAFGARQACHDLEASRLIADANRRVGPEIEFSPSNKDMRRLPSQIRDSVAEWMRRVEEFGLYEVRRSFGAKYHDESLRGDRQGQRSVRLNIQWRLIYEEISPTRIRVIEIIPHNY